MKCNCAIGSLSDSSEKFESGVDKVEVKLSQELKDLNEIVRKQNETIGTLVGKIGRLDNQSQLDERVRKQNEMIGKLDDMIEKLQDEFYAFKDQFSHPYM